MSQEVADPPVNTGTGKEEDAKHTNEDSLNKSVKTDGHVPPLQNGKRPRENEEENEKDENGESDDQEIETKRLKVSDEEDNKEDDVKENDVDEKPDDSTPPSNGETVDDKEEKADSPEKMDTTEEPKSEANSDKGENTSSDEKAESDESKNVEDKKESEDTDKVVPPVNDDGPLDLGIKKDSSKSASSDTSADNDKTSDAKGSESDKENVDEGPMDLSKPLNLSSKAPEDIIMLSDEDENGRRASKLMNGTVELTPEQVKERKKLVRLLQENLRNEEAKLVLLKKIRQSQMMHTLQDSQSNQVNKGQGSQNSSRGAIPPPLVRGQPSSQSMGMRHSNSMPVLNNRPSSGSGHSRSGSSNNQGPPPLVMAPHHNSQSLSNQHSSSSSSRGMHAVASSPNLMQGYRGQSSQSQSNQPEQTPAQRQAAAKLALRKQLEKTLLQIPPPKPPPPEMNFIPSLVGNEFIMLVGLEDVVKRITKKKKVPTATLR